MYAKTVELRIPAYYMADILMDSETGNALPEDYSGLCEVYSKENYPALFFTHPSETGREWHCIKANTR
jgi:hypothetical protein